VVDGGAPALLLPAWARLGYQPARTMPVVCRPFTASSRGWRSGMTEVGRVQNKTGDCEGQTSGSFEELRARVQAEETQIHPLNAAVDKTTVEARRLGRELPKADERVVPSIC